jgi:hypothetical protein
VAGTEREKEVLKLLNQVKEAEIRTIMVQSQPGLHKTYLKKTNHKKGLVEWLKV